MKTLEETRAFFQGDRFALEACGITIDEVTAEGARCSMPLTPLHLNAGGVAQGGAIFTLCDFAFAVAANAGGTLTVSQGASVSFLRPGAGARLCAVARRVSEGRATCLYAVQVTDERGNLVAHATVTGFRKGGAGVA